MKRKISIALVGLLAAVALVLWIAVPRLNDYRTQGELVLSGLAAPVEVVRDEKGMAYARAQSLEDALFAQGFLTAQDRFFNMHLVRLMTQGRLTELAGERARDLDVRHRTVGLHRIARAHAAELDERDRRLFERYVDGVNAFLACCPDDLHLEFRLAGLEPEPWTIEDSLAVVYLMAWNNSANVGHEIVYAQLAAAVGAERARTLDPRNVNPDDPPGPEDEAPETDAPDADEPEAVASLGRLDDPRLKALLDRDALQIGSNNWVASPEITESGRPLLAGDPHLDTRMLPGVWYPMGLIWPENRAVGATVPGVPGLSLGRTEHIALSMTNAYGDSEDLYVETVDPDDPDRYLEGNASLPFEVREETLRIRDADAPGGFREETIEIRSTRRGPVVSGRLSGLEGAEGTTAGTAEGTAEETVVTLRWAAADPDLRTPRLGFFTLLTDRTVDEVNRSLDLLPMLSLNFVFADAEGGIGWRVSGRLPLRIEGAGPRPWVVTDDTDPWIGWIPYEEMPQDLSSTRPWLGTANHLTISRDYPHYFSNRAGASYRYARMKELFHGADSPLTVDDFWAWQRDMENPLAREVAPILVHALRADEATRALGDVLADWDHRDTLDAAGPLVFQEVFNRLAVATFADELGDDVTADLLDRLYYWQERFHHMVVAGGTDADTWLDDVTTDETETRDQMIVRAGLDALERLTPLVGADPTAWRWGDLHYLRLFHPLRRDGLGSDALGSGPMPMGGSGETLYRGRYRFGSPYEATSTASLRLVVDFADNDRIRAVLPGGVAGRAFHPHQQDQVEAFMTGEPTWWWLSDTAIDTHARNRLRLLP